MSDRANDNFNHPINLESIKEALERSEHELRLVARLYRQRGFVDQAEEVSRALRKYSNLHQAGS